MSFSVISQNFLIFWWVSKDSLFWQLGPESAPPKHYKNRGFSTPIFENSYASRDGHFWTKKTQIHKFQLSFFWGLFLLFQQQKTQKSAETPIFIIVF